MTENTFFNPPDFYTQISVLHLRTAITLIIVLMQSKSLLTMLFSCLSNRHTTAVFPVEPSAKGGGVAQIGQRDGSFFSVGERTARGRRGVAKAAWICTAMTVIQATVP